MAPPTEKKSLGRRKIEIKKLLHEGRKQVAFSKRRVGIFKKAAELAVLCDAQIAVVTFSPGDKCFSFGHSSVDAVVGRFTSGDPSAAGAAGLPEDFGELNRDYAAASAVLEEEKRREAELNSAAAGGRWWEKDAAEMTAEEVEVFLTALRELKFNVEKKIETMGRGKLVVPDFPGGGAPPLAAESGERSVGYFCGDWEESGGGMFSNGFEPFWVNGQQP